MPPIEFDTVPRAPLRSALSKATLPQAASESEPARSGRKIKLIDRLNLQNWDMDPLRVYSHLTGKELDVDEHSRLVSGTKPATR